MNVKKIGAAFLVGAMVAGCGDSAKKDEEAPKADAAAVVVNGETLMRSQIDADVEKILETQKIPEEQRQYAREMFVNQLAQSFLVEKVLVGKAKADGYKVTEAERKARGDEFLKAVAKMPDAPKSMDEYFKKFPLGEARAREEFENGILIDKMLKAEQAKAPAKDYKAEAKKTIDGIVAANAQALEKIKALKAELDKTPAKDLAAKFAALAKENSVCPSGKAKGGDLGLFARGQMVKEFDEAAFKLPLNKVSDPVKTQYGYHLIMSTNKVAAVKAEGEKPAQPEKVQASHILLRTQDVPDAEELQKRLKSQANGEFAREFIMNLIRKAKITTSDEFKHLVPPAEAAPEAPVEKSAKK